MANKTSDTTIKSARTNATIRIIVFFRFSDFLLNFPHSLSS